MTVPKWLIPVLAVVAALAVGVAAVFIGFRFATAQAVPVAAPTITAPVLAPVDPASALASDLGSDGTVSASPIAGLRSVTDPDSVGADAVPPDIVDAVGALAASDDPGSDPAALAAADSAGSGGDPCAPSDGSTPPADCPPGLMSTVLHDIALPAFMVADPTSADCNTRAYGPDFVQFGVVTNAPAHTVMTWQQDGGDIHTVNLATSDSDNAAWQNSLAGADSIGPWIYLHVCVTLDHLTPFEGVRVTLHSTDFQGRTASTDHTHFPQDTRQRPPTDIIPVGNSTVFVSAPLTADDEVRIRAIPVPASGTASCDDAPALTGSFQVIRPQETHPVSADSLAAAGYKPEFTLRTSTAFAVPAATQVLVCVRWYNLHRSPVWESDSPYFRSELRLASPDLDVPTVRLDSMVLNTPVAHDSITIDGATEGGSHCGSWTGPDADGRTVDLGGGIDFCAFSTLLGRSDADGALNVTTRVQTPGGLAVMPNLLPIALEPCESCAGRTRTFDVPLSTFVRPTGLCSGDCPANTGQAVGVARITATWTPRLGSGSPGWYFGERVEGAYTVPPPDFPRMDTSYSVVLGPVDSATRSQSASFRLVTDRQVSYRVQLNDGACLQPGGSPVVSSDALNTSVEVHLAGLCLGSHYGMSVTLTAADGSTATYTTGLSEHFWPASEFYTTPATQQVIAALSITKPGAPLVYLSDLRLSFAGTRSSLGVRPGRQCFDGPITPAATNEELHVGEQIPVEVYLAYRPGDQADPATRYADGALECTPADGTAQQYLRFTGSVTIGQILAGATVTMTDPASGYTATLALHHP